MSSALNVYTQTVHVFIGYVFTYLKKEKEKANVWVGLQCPVLVLSIQISSLIKAVICNSNLNIAPTAC